MVEKGCEEGLRSEKSLVGLEWRRRERVVVEEEGKREWGLGRRRRREMWDNRRQFIGGWSSYAQTVMGLGRLALIWSKYLRRWPFAPSLLHTAFIN